MEALYTLLVMLASDTTVSVELLADNYDALLAHVNETC